VLSIERIEIIPTIYSRCSLDTHNMQSLICKQVDSLLAVTSTCRLGPKAPQQSRPAAAPSTNLGPNNLLFTGEVIDGQHGGTCARNRC